MKHGTLSAEDNIVIPAMLLPGFRSSLAVQRGVEKNLLIVTWGGLGDQVCAEPTLRFALKTFKDAKVSLASELPFLFEHLSFEKVYDLKAGEQPNPEDYLIFNTIVPDNDTNFVWQFMSHMLINCVEYPCLCAFRSQLPNDSKEIYLKPKDPDGVVKEFLDIDGGVFVHAGRHWPSKTFPKDWWDEVLAEMIKAGLRPILIGAETDDNRGTVAVDTTGCVDLRGKLSLLETAWLLQRAKVLVSNDSLPIHLAAARNPDDPRTGKTWVGFIATCKHPDYLMHWRSGVFGYREENLGLGGLWDFVDNVPNKEQRITAEFVEENILRTWLPCPPVVASWAKEKS